MSLLKEIKDIIDKEKKSVLLSSPNVLKEGEREHTVAGRQKFSQVRPDGDTRIMTSKEQDNINAKVDAMNANDATIRNPPEEAEDAKREQNKHLRGGFNLYHGLLTQVFMETQNVTGEAAQIIRKHTQLALQELNQDPEVSSVFQNSGTINPKSVAQIVQKTALAILMHLAKKAEQEAIEKGMFKNSTLGE